MSAVHNTWRHIPSGIPKDEAERRRRAARWQAEAFGAITPQTRLEDRMRIARKVAEIHGLSGLFGQ